MITAFDTPLLRVHGQRMDYENALCLMASAAPMDSQRLITRRWRRSPFAPLLFFRPPMLWFS